MSLCGEIPPELRRRVCRPAGGSDLFIINTVWVEPCACPTMGVPASIGQAKSRFAG